MNYYKLRPCTKGDECSLFKKDALSCAFYHKPEELACIHYYHGNCRQGDSCRQKHYQLNVIDARTGEHIYGFEHDFKKVKDVINQAENSKHLLVKLENDIKIAKTKLDKITEETNEAAEEFCKYQDQVDVLKRDPDISAEVGFNIAFANAKLAHFLDGVDKLTLNVKQSDLLLHSLLIPSTQIADYTKERLKVTQKLLEKQANFLEEQRSLVNSQLKIISDTLAQKFFTFTFLPRDIVIYILNYLDFRSRARLIRASKDFRLFVKDGCQNTSVFRRLQKTHYYSIRENTDLWVGIKLESTEDFFRMPPVECFTGHFILRMRRDNKWTIAVLAPIRDCKFHGIVTYYRPCEVGQSIRQIGVYKNGNRHGEFTVFNKKGHQIITGRYDNNVKTWSRIDASRNGVHSVVEHTDNIQSKHERHIVFQRDILKGFLSKLKTEGIWK